ncbi:MAG: AzlC family ABC transporter permease [Saezia sp.]
MKTNFKRALLVSLPVFMGYFPAGVAFGVLATAAGFPWWLSILMSVTSLAGSAQYANIPLVAGGYGIFSVSLNTFAINLRHIFYALPLLDSMPKNKLKRAYCLFALTDECFSVMTTLPKEEREGIYLKAAMLMHSYWVFATCVGVAVAGWLTWIPNLDFAMACLFMVLWYEQIKRYKIIWPVFLGVVLFIISLLVLPGHALMLALSLCVVSILLKEILSKKAAS